MRIPSSISALFYSHPNTFNIIIVSTVLFSFITGELLSNDFIIAGGFFFAGVGIARAFKIPAVAKYHYLFAILGFGLTAYGLQNWWSPLLGVLITGLLYATRRIYYHLFLFEVITAVGLIADILYNLNF